jgi:hypothetical protein
MLIPVTNVQSQAAQENRRGADTIGQAAQAAAARMVMIFGPVPIQHLCECGACGHKFRTLVHRAFLRKAQDFWPEAVGSCPGWWCNAAEQAVSERALIAP